MKLLKEMYLGLGFVFLYNPIAVIVILFNLILDKNIELVIYYILSLLIFIYIFNLEMKK